MTTRRALAAAGLAVFLVGEAWPAHPSPQARWSKLSAMAGVSERERRLSGAAFFFDPAYGRFLEDVRDATPPGATIALEAPLTHELYTYTASYVLAPRRLVTPDRRAEAQYAAVYGTGTGTGTGTGAGEKIELPAGSGSLSRLR